MKTIRSRYFFELGERKKEGKREREKGKEIILKPRRATAKQLSGKLHRSTNLHKRT